VSTNNITVNTATFVYNAVTGVATLSLSNPGTGNPVLSANVAAGKVFDNLIFTNNGGGDMKFTALTVGAVPEPSAALHGAVGALVLLRRRRN